jgi:hypothetical protein
MHTLECYRCHKVGRIAQYCPSTAPVDSGAPTDATATALTESAAAVATTTTTSIENYWMPVANGESPLKESW